MRGAMRFTGRHGQNGRRLVVVDVVEVEVVGSVVGSGEEVGEEMEQEGSGDEMEQEGEVDESWGEDDDMGEEVSDSSDECTFEDNGESKVLKVLTESLEGV